MPSAQPFARNDTMLGVCQSLGEDLGFNPNYLRVLFGVSLIWNPAVVIAVYVALALVIAVSHWVFPNPRSAAAPEAAEPAKAEPVEPVHELAQAA